MAEEYIQLIETYRRMFGMVDAFHFNSQNTADMFARYIEIPAKSKTIPITHNGIKDRRKKREFKNPVLRLGFIGSESPYKGLPMLKEVIAKLNTEGYGDKVSLDVYGGRTGKDDEFVNVHHKGKFISPMMQKVFDDMDLLVVPSIWHETFSLVTIEALSFGTPVLVSDRVGAKDVVKTYSKDFVYRDQAQLSSFLKEIILDRTPLKAFNEMLIRLPWEHSIEKHAKEIIDKIYK